MEFLSVTAVFIKEVLKVSCFILCAAVYLFVCLIVEAPVEHGRSISVFDAQKHFHI